MLSTVPSPRLVALATAVPPHILRQPDVQLMAQGLFERSLGSDTALLQVFDHAQIETRNTCVPLEWFASDHSFAEKNDRYVANAQCLAGDATWRALSRWPIPPSVCW